MSRRSKGFSIPAAAATTFVAVYLLTPARDASPEAGAPTSIASSIATATYYPGCNAARAAGAAPIYRGQPGYREEMDGDSDGIACEPHRNLY
jgi:hypothetical protein